MNEADAFHALDRIEEALVRIEAAARHPRYIEDAGLRQRHEDLKASVARSLSDLDALLAQREPG